jgi:hypothetical protein
MLQLFPKPSMLEKVDIHQFLGTKKLDGIDYVCRTSQI